MVILLIYQHTFGHILVLKKPPVWRNFLFRWKFLGIWFTTHFYFLQGVFPVNRFSPLNKQATLNYHQTFQTHSATTTILLLPCIWQRHLLIPISLLQG